jgi:uncharacterized membrane protein YedE/YeeE
MSRLALIGRVASGLNGLLGAGIMLAVPLMTEDAARLRYQVWASVFVGGIIMAFGMTRLTSPEGLRALSWANLVLGASIALSPWLCRFSSDEMLMWAGVIVGALIMGFAVMSVTMTQKLARA